MFGTMPLICYQSNVVIVGYLCWLYRIDERPKKVIESGGCPISGEVLTEENDKDVFIVNNRATYLSQRAHQETQPNVIRQYNGHIKG